MADATRALPGNRHDEPSSPRPAQILSCNLDYRSGGSFLESRPGSILESAEGSMKKDIEEPGVVWGEYDRLEPGDYPAFCKRAKWYWDPSYKRWTCMLLFDVLGPNSNDSLGTIPLWLRGARGQWRGFEVIELVQKARIPLPLRAHITDH
jgi:hypothetical protein